MRAKAESKRKAEEKKKAKEKAEKAAKKQQVTSVASDDEQLFVRLVQELEKEEARAAKQAKAIKIANWT